VILWAWEARARGQGGSGVSGSAEQARRAAGKWMRANGATAALLEQVRLAIDAGLDAGYERTGATLAGRLHPSGRVTWTRDRG
jgi:hypothetical protein